MAKRMRLQIVDTAIRVAKREFRKFHAHRVDGKVTTQRRLLKAQLLVGMHHESAVAVTHLAFGARKREIERESLHGEMDDAERLPDQVRTAVLRENGHERVLRHVVYLDIVVAARPAQKSVADPAAHQEGTAARLADIARDFQKASRQIRFEPLSRKRLYFRHLQDRLTGNFPHRPPRCPQQARLPWRQCRQGLPPTYREPWRRNVHRCSSSARRWNP